MASAPDGGCRAWLVVFARFVLALIVMGSFKALGVFVPVMQESLGLSAGVVGFSFGLSGALNFLLGPVSAATLQLTNYRVMVMIGGTMSATGLILAGQAKAASHLTLSMVLLGLGNCALAVPAVVALSDYFEKKFALVNGLSTAGGAVGMIVLSPLAEFLIQRYGWRGAFLVVGAITYNMVVAGALMKPLHGRKHTDQLKQQQCELEGEQVDNNDLMTKGSEEHFKDLSTEGNSEAIEPSKVKDASKVQHCWKSLRTSLGFQLFCEQKHVIVYMTGFCLWGVVYSGWTIFLVSYALTKDIDPLKAALLSSLGGLGSLIGRASHGLFIDLGIITGAEMFSLLSWICSVALFLHAFLPTFAGLGVLSTIVGMCIGTRFALAVVVMKENVDEASFKVAAGWCYFFQGLGTAFGSPLTGLSYDLTSSYRVAFFVMAGLEVTIGVLFLAGPRIKRLIEQNNS